MRKSFSCSVRKEGGFQCQRVDRPRHFVLPDTCRPFLPGGQVADAQSRNAETFRQGMEQYDVGPCGGFMRRKQHAWGEILITLVYDEQDVRMLRGQPFHLVVGKDGPGRVVRIADPHDIRIPPADGRWYRWTVLDGRAGGRHPRIPKTWGTGCRNAVRKSLRNQIDGFRGSARQADRFCAYPPSLGPVGFLRHAVTVRDRNVLVPQQFSRCRNKGASDVW